MKRGAALAAGLAVVLTAAAAFVAPVRAQRALAVSNTSPRIGATAAHADQCVLCHRGIDDAHPKKMLLCTLHTHTSAPLGTIVTLIINSSY